MPGIDTIASFFLASLLLTTSPGPDIIFVLTQSMLQGPKAGLAVMAGLCSGLVIHTTAVAAGVAAIFHTSPAAYATLRIIGACYLLYLAWLAFRASAASTETSGRKAVPLSRLYGRGIIMNIIAGIVFILLAGGLLLDLG